MVALPALVSGLDAELVRLGYKERYAKLSLKK
jgi:hypothetical protein